MRSKMVVALFQHCFYISVLLLRFVSGNQNGEYAVMEDIHRINKKAEAYTSAAVSHQDTTTHTFCFRHIKGKMENCTYPASEDDAIIESDIRLPPAESAATSGEFSNVMRLRRRLWPGGVVPYVLDDNIVNRTKHMEVLRVAMEIWENTTCVKFVKRTYQRRYARILYGSGCTSNIGALITKPSELTLGHSCNLVAIATHELGHLLGFGHEQNRPDRDTYISVLWENIDQANRKAFKRQSHWVFQSFGIPYDYNSIMHYGLYHFSKNGEPTMVSRDPKIKWFGSQYPSKLDIKQMNLLYSCSDIPIFPDHFSIQSISLPFFNCIAIDQSRDTEWRTKYLCYKPALKRLNITWSPNGAIIGQDCINTVMPYESTAELWARSFLCMPRDSVLILSWSISSPLNGQKCLVMREGKRSRKSYFLCGKSRYKKIDGGWSKWSSWRPCTQKCGGGLRIRERSCDSPVPKYGGAPCRGRYYETIACNTNHCPEFPSWPDDFRFMFIGFTPRRKECISIYERFQYFDWAQAKLCWPSTKRSINVRWSDFGPIPGMRCTNITERSGRYQSYGWYDNYLCVKDVPYNFKWSTNGPIKGLKCLRWKNDLRARLNLWQNNYLCANEYPTPKRSSLTGCYPRWRSFSVNRVPYCYLPISKERRSWEKAQEYCEENKANLASVTTNEEQDFINTITANAVWIGLHKKQDWQWKDGSRLEYLNWSRGEPNNGGTSNVPENCAILNTGSNKWNDFPCATKFNFICKMRGVL